jgi:hypothetical protein
MAKKSPVKNIEKLILKIESESSGTPGTVIERIIVGYKTLWRVGFGDIGRPKTFYYGETILGAMKARSEAHANY